MARVLRETERDTLVMYLTAQPDVGASYLIGSEARGDAGPASDVDVAVLFSADVRKDRYKAAVRRGLMSDDLEGLLGRSVDAVDFDGASPAFAFEILKDAKGLTERDHNQRVRSEMRQVAMDQDMSEEREATLERSREYFR